MQDQPYSLISTFQYLKEKILSHSFFNKTKQQFKRWIFYNIVTMPIGAILYIPYNLFFLGYTKPQFVKWAFTGTLMALLSNIIMQKVVSMVVRFMDKHIPESE